MKINNETLNINVEKSTTIASIKSETDQFQSTKPSMINGNGITNRIQSSEFITLTSGRKEIPSMSTEPITTNKPCKYI